MNKGETITQEIPHKEWTLVIGYAKKPVRKWTVGVNGVEMSELPKVDLKAASYPRFCKSMEEKIYEEFKRSVSLDIVLIAFISSDFHFIKTCCLWSLPPHQVYNNYLFVQIPHLLVLRRR